MAIHPLLRLPTMTADLARVDEELLAVVETDDDLLTEIAGHLIRAGGKRLRPGFCLAAAAADPAAGGLAGDGWATQRADAVSGGVSVELVHLGSLYHDDVMDEATTRRTVDSVNFRWGNLKAILGGDFLLAKASEIAASLGTEVAGLLAATIARLCEGQVRELRNLFDVARSEEAYLAAIAGKTAALFSSACRIGALVAGHPRPVVDQLTEFGQHYGMAFQIVDDILDVVASDEELGKPAGNDLVQGVYTLPVIRTLGGRHGDGLRRVLGRPLGEGEMDEARSVVRANGAVAASVATAREYADRAAAAVAPWGTRRAGTPCEPAPSTCWSGWPPFPPEGPAVRPRPPRPSAARLTGRAPGGGPPVPGPTGEHGAAAPTVASGPPVAVEVVLVVPEAAVDPPVVPQRGSPPLQGGRQHLPQRPVQALGLGPGDEPRARGTPPPATTPRRRRCCPRRPPGAG